MAHTKLSRAKAADYKYRRTDKKELKFEQGAYGERFRYGVAAQQDSQVTLSNEQICKPVLMLEIIFFSKIHLVTPDEFVAKAADYHRILRNEALILYGDLTDNRKIYNEWANPSGFIDSAVAHAVAGTSAVIGWFKEVKHAPKPDIKEFDDLIERLDVISSTIYNITNSLQYDDIHEAGVQLALIREDSRRLYKQIAKFRNVAIDTAEDMTKGLETVESASFQVLAIVPTITMMDPLREAAYRIGLVILRASARSAGAALADASIVQELCGVLKSDVPPLIVDVATSGLNKYLKGIKMPVLQREFCIFIVKQHIEFICDLVLLVHAKGSNVTDEDFKQLGMNRLTSCFAALLSQVLGGKPTDTATQKLAKALAESTLNTVFRDAMTARETAKNTNRSFWEVFLSDLPWTIVKIIQGTFVGVIHRNAASIAHQEEEQGATTPQKAVELLRSQNASAIFNAKLKMPTGAAVKAKQPLPAMTLNEYRHWSSMPTDDGNGGANIHPDLAGPLRRYAHDSDQFVAFRISRGPINEYLSEFSMRPKPEWVKPKTARTGNNIGKVVKPVEAKDGNPGTHGQDYAAAKKLWDDNKSTLQANGAMVNEDGVVFHPDMLDDWARANPSDKDVAKAAHAYLTSLASGEKEIWDLTTKAGKDALDARPEVRALLQRARIGYYSDLDLAEVIDAQSGERVAMGAGNENKDDRQQLAYLQTNRDNLDKAINVNDDLKNVPPEFLGPDKQPRVSANEATSHHQSLIQHGSAYEYYKGGFDNDEIAVVGPNGFLRTFKNRQEYEDGMQKILKGKYQPREIRGKQLGKDSWKDPTKKAKASGSGERVQSDKVFRMQWYYERALHDIPGLGQPVSLQDIGASLFHRGLTMKAPAYIKIGVDRHAVRQVEQQFEVFVAGDLDGENLVLAAQCNSSMGDSLARLARAAKALVLDKASGVTVWYEIYSAFKPVTTDYILNRIGGPDPGPGGDTSDVADKVTSLAGQKGSKLYAFCLDGFIPTFSPPLKYAQSHGRRSLDDWDAAQRDKEVRDVLVASLGTQPGTYGDMQGQKLADVWEDSASRKLSQADTKISGRPVVVFTSGIAALPATVVPRELTEIHGAPVPMRVS